MIKFNPLHLCFVETSLELVPIEILHHPSVKRDSKRRNKPPKETLLDKSIHYHGMYGLPDLDKRGRPDIIHLCLLAALSSPLNKQGYLRVWVNTLKRKTIEIDPIVNLPKGYSRFQSLMEQLLIKNRVPPESKNPLLKTYDGELCDLKEGINPSRIIALTSHGEPSSLDKLCQEITKEERPMVLIGAYPHGPMSNETLALADESISIYQDTLEAWVVTSRLIYEYEKQSGLI